MKFLKLIFMGPAHYKVWNSFIFFGIFFPIISDHLLLRMDNILFVRSYQNLKTAWRLSATKLTFNIFYLSICHADQIFCLYFSN